MKIRVVSLDFAICPIIAAIFKPKNVICVNNDETYISEIKLLSLMESHPKYLFQNTITVKNNPARKYIYWYIPLYWVPSKYSNSF